MTDVVKHDIHVFDSILPKLPESLQLLLKVLPVLDGVTVQLLQYFCANPFNTTLAIVSEDISNLYYVETQMFNSLLTVFKRLLCYYNKDPTTLKVSHILPGVWHDHHTPPSFIQSHERYILSVLRKVNLCLFMLTLLGKLPFGIDFLAYNFIEIFCYNVESSKIEDLVNADQTRLLYGRLKKPQTVIYLDLMTQYYISMISSSVGKHSQTSDLLEKVFPDTILEEFRNKTIKYNGSILQIELQCTDSESDFKQRCARRKMAILETLDLESLKQKYDWEERCKEVFNYAVKEAEVLLYGKRGKSTLELTSFPAKQRMDDTSNAVTNNKTDKPHVEVYVLSRKKDSLPEIGIASTAGAIKESNTLNSSELANKAFKPKLKQKKMWTKEEEDCLREGLLNNGPAWSKILSLYGPGGTISETLKNRSQVQLKDKARNWKMYYLKNAMPIPTYLEKVTGDLERGMKANKRRPKAGTTVIQRANEKTRYGSKSQIADDSLQQKLPKSS